jgi:hypothetical protein
VKEAVNTRLTGLPTAHSRRNANGCPHCGARHSTPVDSDDLTVLVEPDGSEFVVLRSPDTAEHDPDYREVGRFSTRDQALEFLAADG